MVWMTESDIGAWGPQQDSHSRGARSLHWLCCECKEAGTETQPEALRASGPGREAGEQHWLSGFHEFSLLSIHFSSFPKLAVTPFRDPVSL